MNANALVRRATQRVARLDWSGALKLCRRALTIDGANAEALHLAGCVRSHNGDLDAAAVSLAAAVEREPGRYAWHSDLGIVHAAKGDWPAAARAFSRARDLAPEDPDILGNYANALLECAFYAPALRVYRQACAMRPESSSMSWGLARCLMGLGLRDEAISVAERRLNAEPGSVRGHELLAEIRLGQLRYEQEFGHREKVFELKPEDAEAAALAATAACNVGDVSRALELFGRAEALEGRMRAVCLNTLLHYAGSTARSLVEAHRRRVRGLGRPVRRRRFENSRDTKRKLRIGYVSGEGLRSPSFCFLTPFLRRHDRSRFETFFYHGSPEAASVELRSLASVWRDAGYLKDEEIAEQILRDRIDVLVDVSGNYGRGLLGVFRLRSAPVQVSFPNYPATTGIPEMDYIFTDEWTSPPETDFQYVEKACRLNSGYLAWEAPVWASAVSPLPAARNGRITFGLYQRAAKLNDGVWDAIAAVLRAVPKSRLLVHFASDDLDLKQNAARRRITAPLALRGVSERRIRFAGMRNGTEHLDLIAEADIALDTFPYNGQTTNCECLWMGVPVVTLAGEAHVARVGAGLLYRAGLGEWVGENAEDYVRIAVRAAEDLKGLAELRAGLRQRIRSSSLVEARAVTKDMERAYRRMWSGWCAEQEGRK